MRIPFIFAFCCFATLAHAEDRSYDGTGNNLNILDQGAAHTGIIRFGYSGHFINGEGGMLTDDHRANARDISNALFAQSHSVKSARGLSDMTWAWGQFVTHDMELVTTSDGPAINGSAPIAVNDPTDPLGPAPIPFTRANWTEISGRGGRRSPVNEVTSYLDASHVYGSDAARAAAVTSTGGKLLLDQASLLPLNAAGLEVENNGPLPDTQLFLAGDIRANENPLLSSLHTIFAREHNRLVDAIDTHIPGLTDQQRYQLARKLVGAEIQAITYNEFLPALVGRGADTPKAEEHQYSTQLTAAVTNAFAHAAFRLGHSQVSSNLTLVDETGSESQLPLRDAFYNPTLIGNDPDLVDQLLRGAAQQRAEEIDTLMVDDLRTALFGPPGAGGLDLAALNIQRGRDAGLPNYTSLLRSHGARHPGSISGISSDPAVTAALEAIYDGNLNNIDAWVGGLAEDHVPGASVGPFFQAVIESQFRRLRDGDRLFYTGNEARLYADGVLRSQIAAIVDLDSITLADIIQANTGVTNLQSNVFFVPDVIGLNEGDFNNDGVVDSADYTTWRDGFGILYDDDAYALWKANYGLIVATPDGATTANIPEPATAALLTLLVAIGLAVRHDWQT